MASFGDLLRNRHAPARRSIANLAEFQPTGTMSLNFGSDSFADGGRIDLRFAARGRGENVSPQFTWSDLPAGTEQLLLVMEDPDVPLPLPIIHTAALFDPTGSSGTIDEGELSRRSDRFTFVPWLGMTGYRGPRPLRGHGDHHYGFYLFALDKPVPATSFRKLRRAIAGNVLARGVITGVQRDGE